MGTSIKSDNVTFGKCTLKTIVTEKTLVDMMT